jgi:hypothetical protein
MPGLSYATTELRTRRKRIARALLGALVVLCGVAYLPSVWAALRLGSWRIVLLDTAVYAVVVFAFARKNLDEGVRSATVIIVLAVLGVGLGIVLGIESSPCDPISCRPQPARKNRMTSRCGPHNLTHPRICTG